MKVSKTVKQERLFLCPPHSISIDRIHVVAVAYAYAPQAPSACVLIGMLAAIDCLIV